jgi:hypothetical protein
VTCLNASRVAAKLDSDQTLTQNPPECKSGASAIIHEGLKTPLTTLILGFVLEWGRVWI